jgi:PAS domain S-box-containing protein
MEGAIFALAGHVFLQTGDVPACLGALERLFGRIRLQYLLLFLVFVRAAHYWTRVHPEIALEDDINHLLATHEALANCILNDPESSSDAVSQSLLDELPALRLNADRAIGLLGAIVDSSEDAIVSKSLDGVITTWNAGAERLFGYPANEAIGKHISLIIPENRRNEETAILEEISRGQRIEHFDTVRRRKDGSTFDISLTISPVRDAAGKVIGASKIARDISQRKRIERSLRESEERYRTLAGALDTQVQFRTQELQRRNEEIVRQADLLRDLSARMLQFQDEERRRFARDLHDSAGQTLAVMSMRLAQMAKDAKSDPAQLGNTIQELEELVQGLTREIRTTSYLLYPPMLDESGLSYALNWYVEGLVERSGLKIDLDIPVSFERLSREMELVIFRVVQECLTNIHRHSGSKAASIRIERQHENVHVTVQDSGQGMSHEKLAEIQTHGKGVGLRGMRERVRSLQGELTIESSTSGTKVSAILPAKKPALMDRSGTQQRGIA